MCVFQADTTQPKFTTFYQLVNVESETYSNLHNIIKPPPSPPKEGGIVALVLISLSFIINYSHPPWFTPPWEGLGEAFL